MLEDAMLKVIRTHRTIIGSLCNIPFYILNVFLLLKLCKAFHTSGIENQDASSENYNVKANELLFSFSSRLQY